jgi:predicted dehydrogenase
LLVKKLKIAVIGAGRLGGFHAQKLAGFSDIELVAVVDPLPENRNRVAAECRTTSLADHRELLERLDAAVIASPTRYHHSLALECLEHGIHLLVEKPLCSTYAESEDLVAAAKRRNVVLQVGHVERFNPAFDATVPHVRNPKYIEAVRSSGFTFRSTDVGVVLDLMIHDIDLVLSLAGGRLRKVDALGLSVLGGHEDVANARLEFDDGCVAALSASRVSYEAVRRMQVWSPRAFASIDFAARTTTLVRPSETLLSRRFDVESLTPAERDYYRDHLAEEHLPRERLEFNAVDALALELRDFVDSINSARKPRVTGEQASNALAVAEQILARIHTHAWDDTADGPVGPLAAPRPRVIPVPHFNLPASEVSLPRREAG